MQVQAKFNCENVEDNGDSQNVTFRAVYSPDKTHENYSWSKWTPAGFLSMNISNPNLKDHFTSGKEYILTIEEV